MRTTRQKQREMKSVILQSSVLSTENPSVRCDMFCYVVFAPAIDQSAWVCSSASSFAARFLPPNKLKTTTQGRVFCSSDPLVGSSATNTMANLSTINFLAQTSFLPSTNPVTQFQEERHQITQPSLLSPSF